MRGRKPTPTKLKKVRGNPGRRPLNQDEPEVDEGIGPPPMHLNANEAHLWKEYTSHAWWLTALNRGTLERYVVAVAMMRELKPQIDKMPKILYSGTKKVMKGGEEIEIPIGAYQNPLISIYNKQGEQALKHAAELGFTPVSISRIHAPEKKPKSKERAQLLSFEGGKK